MDYPDEFWGTNIPLLRSFQPMSPIPEMDCDGAWYPTEPRSSDNFLPLNQYVPASHHTADPNHAAQEIANLAGQVRHLQNQVLEMKEQTQSSLSEMTEVVTKWSLNADKTLVQMLKDVASLDRNYLKLIPWCYQVHEKVSECIAEKGITQVESGQGS